MMIHDELAVSVSQAACQADPQTWKHSIQSCIHWQIEEGRLGKMWVEGVQGSKLACGQ